MYISMKWIPLLNRHQQASHGCPRKRQVALYSNLDKSTWEKYKNPDYDKNNLTSKQHNFHINQLTLVLEATLARGTLLTWYKKYRFKKINVLSS